MLRSWSWLLDAEIWKRLEPFWKWSGSGNFGAKVTPCLRGRIWVLLTQLLDPGFIKIAYVIFISQIRYITCGATTLSTTTFSITTLSIRSFHVTVSISDCQNEKHCITMLCYYAECCIVFTVMLNLITLSVILLSVIAPNINIIFKK